MAFSVASLMHVHIMTVISASVVLAIRCYVGRQQQLCSGNYCVLIFNSNSDWTRGCSQRKIIANVGTGCFKFAGANATLCQCASALCNKCFGSTEPEVLIQGAPKVLCNLNNDNDTSACEAPFCSISSGPKGDRQGCASAGFHSILRIPTQTVGIYADILILERSALCFQTVLPDKNASEIQCICYADRCNNRSLVQWARDTIENNVASKHKCMHQTAFGDKDTVKAHYCYFLGDGTAGGISMTDPNLFNLTVGWHKFDFGRGIYRFYVCAEDLCNEQFKTYDMSRNVATLTDVQTTIGSIHSVACNSSVAFWSPVCHGDYCHSVCSLRGCDRGCVTGGAPFLHTQQTPCFFSPKKFRSLYNDNYIYCQCNDSDYCPNPPIQPKPDDLKRVCYENLSPLGHCKGSVCAIRATYGIVNNTTTGSNMNVKAICLNGPPIYMGRVVVNVSSIAGNKICVLEGGDMNEPDIFCFCSNHDFCNDHKLLQWGTDLIQESEWPLYSCALRSYYPSAFQFCRIVQGNSSLQYSVSGITTTNPALFTAALGCVITDGESNCVCTGHFCSIAFRTDAKEHDICHTILNTSTTIILTSASTVPATYTMDPVHGPAFWNSTNTIVISIVILAVSLSALGSFGMYWYRRYIKLRKQRVEELANSAFKEVQARLSHQDEWELPRKRLEILEHETLGTGSFGLVFKGKLYDSEATASRKVTTCGFNWCYTTVAVKLMPDHACTKTKVNFLEEILKMKLLSGHSHVLQIIGCITVREPYCLVLEYCSDGDLLNYLRNMKATKPNTVTMKDLLSFAWQISDGLEFVISKGFVHRDVAARNVVLNQGRHAKLCDFGLALCISASEKKCIVEERRLPLKWMAPESIQNYEFSPKSDVWSFGVLLFELVTFGKAPYPHVHGCELVNYLVSGKRMSKPMDCSEELYNLMICCWDEDQLKRPNFLQLKQRLEELILDLSNDDYIILKHPEPENNVVSTELGQPEMLTKNGWTRDPANCDDDSCSSYQSTIV